MVRSEWLAWTCKSPWRAMMAKHHGRCIPYLDSVGDLHYDNHVLYIMMLEFNASIYEDFWWALHNLIANKL